MNAPVMNLFTLLTFSYAHTLAEVTGNPAESFVANRCTECGKSAVARWCQFDVYACESCHAEMQGSMLAQTEKEQLQEIIQDLVNLTKHCVTVDAIATTYSEMDRLCYRLYELNNP